MSPASGGTPPPSGSGLSATETDRDPGLQPERTRLAWRRTTLSCAVTAVLALRQVLREDGGTAGIMAVVITAAVFLGFLALAQARIQSLGAPRPPVLAAGAAAATVVCTTALALLGAALLR
jgi:hypothetical protein